MSYLETLQQHNVSLQSLINKANSLPDSSDGNTPLETCGVMILGNDAFSGVSSSYSNEQTSLIVSSFTAVKAGAMYRAALSYVPVGSIIVVYSSSISAVMNGTILQVGSSYTVIEACSESDDNSGELDGPSAPGG